MYCSSAFEVGLFGSCQFFGNLFASLVITPLTDIVGWKKLTNLSNISSMICFLLFILVKNIILFYFLMFFMGITVILKMIIGFMYMMELLPNREPFYTGIFFLIDGLTTIVIPGVIYFLSKNLDYILFSGFLTNLICFLVFLFFPLPESIFESI